MDTAKRRNGSLTRLPSYSKSSDGLIDLLTGFPSAVVVCHDYPDPDAIAAGWAVQRMVVERLHLPTRLVARGQILRPENRCLLGLLQPPLELVRDDGDIPEETAAILVDCDPRGSNHVFAGRVDRLVGVIDHHSSEAAPFDVPFVDIRPEVAATATIAAEYLREQLLVPDERLATAMVYALRTETRGGDTQFTPFDHRILTWLTGLASPPLLARIETAPYHCSYLSGLVLALESTLIYGDTAFCYFPAKCQAGLVAEVADMLIRCEELSYVFCAAAFGRDVMVSVRTDRPEAHAGRIVQQLVEGYGKGGGHQHRAGAKIPNATQLMASGEQLCQELRQRWLMLCGADNRHARSLVEPPKAHALAPRVGVCRPR